MGIFLPLFFLSLFVSSGSSVREKPHLKATQRNEILDNQENQIPFSDSVFTDQLDAIPVVNPTPIYNNPPIPIYNYPPTPVTTQPTITPTTPITTPVTTPITTPVTTPITTPATTTPITTPVTTPVSYGGSWCIASPTASDTALQVAIDYACGYGGANCLGIQPGSSCYNPNTLRDHASYAFNDYYQKNPLPTSCVFGGTAQLTSVDPSSGSCRFASPRSSTSTTTPTNPPPAVQTPPVVFSPTIPNTPTYNTPTYDTPTGSSIYGSEPTGTPSSAVSVSYSRLLLLLTTGLMGLIVATYR